MSIDITRHESVFDPVAWGARAVTVIGVGATGSKIALSLARLGVKRLDLYDSDVVEAHNLANQVYQHRHIGVPKTVAAWEMIRALTDERASVEVRQFEHWHPGQYVGEVVFMMADSMKVRRELFDAIRMNPNTRLVIDSRLGADSGQLYCYQPGDRPSLDAYEATLFSDDDAHVEVSACGASISVGPTSDIISGLAVWRFIRHASGEAIEPALAMGANHLFLEAI